MSFKQDATALKNSKPSSGEYGDDAEKALKETSETSPRENLADMGAWCHSEWRFAHRARRGWLVHFEFFRVVAAASTSGRAERRLESGTTTLAVYQRNKVGTSIIAPWRSAGVPGTESGWSGRT
jgi:hypothetical protein